MKEVQTHHQEDACGVLQKTENGIASAPATTSALPLRQLDHKRAKGGRVRCMEKNPPVPPPSGLRAYRRGDEKHFQKIRREKMHQTIANMRHRVENASCILRKGASGCIYSSVNWEAEQGPALAALAFTSPLVMGRRGPWTGLT